MGDDVRTGGSCQGEASEDCRQGFRRRGFEKRVQVIRAVVRLNLAPPMIMETKATIDKEALWVFTAQVSYTFRVVVSVCMRFQDCTLRRDSLIIAVSGESSRLNPEAFIAMA